MEHPYGDLDPPPRLLLGPGPVNCDPRVLRAMAMPMLGQFDPVFTGYMNEVMALYRQMFQTANRWTFLVDGTARAAIEAVIVSLVQPGDVVLVPVFGRFGHLLAEIARRARARVHTIETEWGTVFAPERMEEALLRHRPKLVAVVHGDTSTTMAQPLAHIGALCRRYDALLYVDATATLGGMDVPVDAWRLDAVSAGLQKCLSGPPGSAPLTFNERVVERVLARKHVEQGIRPPRSGAGPGEIIQSNYLDLPMLMDYWSEQRLNHHTEATSMLYAARECARIVLAEGLERRLQRHELASRALTAGLSAMELELFGDQTHKMPSVTGVVIPEGISGNAVRAAMLEDFGIEIGTSFGPLHGRIWRIGTMGYNCRKQNVLLCLGALEACLRRQGFRSTAGAGVDAALAAYTDAGGA
ncbi:MAG: alanine--glyoxylate aminotransferase family protein [Gammaproteobacteria bacterium]|nr:alanine--glyoxylate aminotransferase family protein [Gammaproteobacteria bacterium]NIR88820.1 alanine--glyoxylate aminotransferase family protein [Gammaproteobacteria bacterium]NIU06424.1 alanine--glyoxylate aminotransferase family protein [Gammaproteobacteria bacterium]NIV53316.1 aminotransferase class V-fold PLP-dependent enzyme [Gammaproteobacteria bacterium]NIV74035.1 aminotransferase class V-fold PLP-dependent enzyme [Gammaproteobacteria bacterium]